jgi:hypothetical protein
MKIQPDRHRDAWQEIDVFLSLHGRSERASANVSSEREIEVLDQMAPQHQAALLLERLMNRWNPVTHDSM